MSSTGLDWPRTTGWTPSDFSAVSNRTLPHGIFELFGEYSGEDGATVRDNMIGWTYDNFRKIATCTSIALQQRNTDLKSYLENIRDERNPGDEISIYILACMYRRHVFIYTKDWWWTTVMFVMPIDEKDVIVKCDLVLVYISPGIYGEVKGIRAPALPEISSSKAHNTSSDTIKSVDTTEGHNKSLEFVTKPVMTGPSKAAATRRIRQSKPKSVAPTTTKPKERITRHPQRRNGLRPVSNNHHEQELRPKRRYSRQELLDCAPPPTPHTSYQSSNTGEAPNGYR